MCESLVPSFTYAKSVRQVHKTATLLEAANNVHSNVNGVCDGCFGDEANAEHLTLKVTTCFSLLKKWMNELACHFMLVAHLLLCNRLN